MTIMNQTCLVSGADYFSVNNPINPYYDGNFAVDKAAAIKDHQNILACFKEAGIELLQVAPTPLSEDSVYTANWALVHHGKAVMSRLPAQRHFEEDYAEKILEENGFDTVHIPEDWHFSGQGDALIVGDYLISGSEYRSDPRANSFAAEALGLKLIQLHTRPKMVNGNVAVNPASGWKDSYFYDIDLALSVLREDLIAYCPAAFDEASQKKLKELPIDKIEVNIDEAKHGFACNLVSTGETVIMSNQAPKLYEALTSHQFKILTPEVKELSRGGGFIRCISLDLAD